MTEKLSTAIAREIGRALSDRVTGARTPPVSWTDLEREEWAERVAAIIRSWAK